jgi:hypothetical protein
MKLAIKSPAAAVVSLTALATSLLIQACGGGAVAQTAENVDAIEGVWESTVALKDCASGTVIDTLKVATIAHHGGGLTSDDSSPPTSRGAAFGQWKHGAGDAYTFKLRFMRFDADGTLAGALLAQRSLTLSANGDAIAGTLTAQVLAVDGSVLQAICGSETGARIY